MRGRKKGLEVIKLEALRHEITTLARKHGTLDYLNRLRTYSKQIVNYFAQMGYRRILSELKQESPIDPTLTLAYIQRTEAKFLELLFASMVLPHPQTGTIKIFEVERAARAYLARIDAERAALEPPARGHRKRYLDEGDEPSDSPVSVLEKFQESEGGL